VLVDHRTYRIRPGCVGPYLELYEKHGFAAQTRHLGRPLAYMFAESGDLNTLVHIWCCEDAADRARKRAAMTADSEWQNYLRLNTEAGNLLGQQTCLMLPAKFAPIKR
jgi:NIPSNAP